jgi:hypothetical protein
MNLNLNPNLNLAALLPTGKGRVLALANLTTWRWALGGEPEAYVKFWSDAVAWLTGEESFRRVMLELPPAAAPGEELLIRAHARDDALRPVSDAEARYFLTEADGTRRAGLLAPAGPGEYAAAVPLRAAGPARVEVRVIRGGGLLGEARAALSVGGSWDESRDASPDFSSLASWSAATGGSFTPLSGATSAWLRRTLAPLSWETGRPSSWSDSPWLPALFLLLLLAEWVFRRRRGLP